MCCITYALYRYIKNKYYKLYYKNPRLETIEEHDLATPRVYRNTYWCSYH